MRTIRFILPLFGLCLFTLAGCRTEEEITHTIVEHPDREEIRMRVGILKNDKTVWFIKLSGPSAIIAKHQKTFDDFFASAKIENDKELTWTDPKAWKKDPPGGGRIATFRSSDKPKEVEIAISTLPAEGFDLLKNVQRWQKQVNVPTSETDKELDGIVKKIKGDDVLLVDLTGRTLHTVSKPPDPLAANKKNLGFEKFAMKKPVAGGAGGAGGGGNVPFKYTVPAGWQKAPAGQFVTEAFAVNDKVKVTLSMARGSLADNINRWRGQVGLGSLKGEDLKKTIIELTIAGKKSSYVDLDNANGPDKDKNRTLGVIIPMGEEGGEAFFVKMMGPRELVGKHKDEFETFVKSFKMEK